MNKFYKIIFITCITILNILDSIECGSLLGRANTMYTTTHNIFRSGQSAIGVVRMNNGFTVATPASGVGSSHGSIAFMDTCLSVSGTIDLRTTNTIFLLEDLTLDNSVTFSQGGGSIYGYDHALILKGDLNIPANSTFHIGGRIVIDGQGNTINIDPNSKFLIDYNSTLTLRNLVLRNTKNQPGNPCVQCSTLGSKLSLKNVILSLVDDFHFRRGQLFIHNDVSFTGTSALIYATPKPLIIDSASTLNFDTGTTFSIAPATFTDCPYTTFPTTTTNNFIKMVDQTSQIYLNGCSLFATLTGIRLTKGALLLDNNVNFQSRAASDIASTPLTLISTTTTSGTGPSETVWSPDGRYVLATSYNGNRFQIFYFNGSSLVDRSGGGVAISVPVFAAWSPDGKFVAVGTNAPTFNIYSVSNGMPTLISSISTLASYGVPQGVKWSPDGKYLAVACPTDGGTKHYVLIYQFIGASVTLLANISAGSTLFPYYVDWSPDGKYLAVSTAYTTPSNLLIYSFTPPSTLTQIGSIQSSTGSNGQAVFSPDGRFIALADIAGSTLKIYSFNGRGGGPYLVGSVATGTGTFGISWFSSGKYIAVGCYSSAKNNTLIYSFSGVGNPVLVGSLSLTNGGDCVGISPDQQFIAVTAGSAPSISVCRVNYINTTPTQSLSNSIVFGNSALGPNNDLNVRVLSDANINVAGILNYDNVS